MVVAQLGGHHMSDLLLVHRSHVRSPGTVVRMGPSSRLRQPVTESMDMPPVMAPGNLLPLTPPLLWVFRGWTVHTEL